MSCQLLYIADDEQHEVRQSIKQNGTNMHSAFEVARSLSPPPDNIILLVDGMPTMEAATTDRDVVGPSERLNMFFSCVRINL